MSDHQRGTQLERQQNQQQQAQQTQQTERVERLKRQTEDQNRRPQPLQNDQSKPKDEGR